MEFKLSQLREIKLLIREIEIDYEWTNQILTFLKTQLKKIWTPIENVQRQLLMLSNLSVATRTCIAQLGVDGNDFQSVADNMREMIDEIEKNNRALISHLTPLGNLAHDSHDTLHKMHGHSFGVICRTIDEFSDVLHGLLSRSREYERDSNDLALNYESFSDNIKKIVVALQSQDILRQSLEHCVAVLQDTAHGKIGCWLPCDYSHIAEITKLQSRQVLDATAAFTTSICQAIDSLEKMSQHAQYCLADANDLDKIPKQISRMVGAMNRDVILVADYNDQLECMKQTSKAVYKSIDSMSDAVCKMDSIDARMRLLGLNSTIKAARIGRGGEALITLSEAIQLCAADISKNGAEVSKSLNEIAKRFAVFKESREDKDTILIEIKSRLSAKIRAFQTIKSQADKIMEQVHSSSQALSTDLDRSIKGISIHTTLEPMKDRIVNSLNELHAEAVRLGAFFGFSFLQKRTKRHLDKLFENYTVDTQRKTHRAHFQEGEESEFGKDSSDAILWVDDNEAENSVANEFEDFSDSINDSAPTVAVKETAEMVCSAEAVDADDFDDNIELF
ncbi:MAG: hypothetical protein JXR40_11040 [Pontiellaceae bacterium]|nr:hypothetical protein [Pontiellaceae bacterium]